MKIAIISDIHGNFPALSAVMEDALMNGAEKFIFSGDYIFDLPYSNEVTRLIKSLSDAYVIQGNKEASLAPLSVEDQADWNIDQMGAVHQTFRELAPEHLTYLMSLEQECLIPLPYGGRVYVTHFIKELSGKPKKTACSSSRFREAMENEPFTHDDFKCYISSYLNEDETRRIISNIDASVIIFGHSHLQWHGYCGGKLVINPGSCGQPLDYDIRAAYTILNDSPSGLTVEEKRVPYDIEDLIKNASRSEVCKKGNIWCSLVFSALRSGKDEFSVFFKLANRIAEQKEESGEYFSNETWRHAGEIFFEGSPSRSSV